MSPSLVAIGAILALVLAFGGRTAQGQQAAYASNSLPSARELSRRAVECLRRGENAPTQEDSLAAFHEGLRYAEQALAIDDNDADAHFARFANHGRILLLQGSTPNPINLLKANRALDRTLELNPNHADALTAKGGLYRQLPRLLGGSARKAEEYLSRAIAIEPEDAVGARVELAQLYRDRGEPQRAIPMLHKAIAIAERAGKLRQLDEARGLLNQLTGEITAGN